MDWKLNRATWQRHLLLLGKTGVAVGLLVWLILGGRLQLGRLASIHLDWRIVALTAMIAGSMIIPAFRWLWLLRIQGLRETAGKILSLTWSSYVAALVLPGTASADLARSYLILRCHNRARARAFSTVLVDRFLGLHSLFFIGSLAAGWMLLNAGLGSAIRDVAALVIAVFLAMNVGLTALLCASSRQLLFRFLPVSWRGAWDESFTSYRGSVGRLIGCFGLSLVSSILTILSFVIAGRLLGEITSSADACLATPLIIVANCLPITPGGIGLAEAVSSQLFFDLGSAVGAEVMLVVRSCTAMLTLPGMLPLLSDIRTLEKAEVPHKATPSGCTNNVEVDSSLESLRSAPADCFSSAASVSSAPTLTRSYEYKKL